MRLSLEDDIRRACEVAPKENEAAWADLVPRLAASDDDAALDALLLCFFHERYCYRRPAKAALVEAVHPDATTRLATKMIEWAPDDDQNLATSHGAEVVARRGDSSVVAQLRAALTEVGEDDMSIIGRSLLIALIALGDSAHEELRAIYREEEDSATLEDMHAWAGRAAYFDAFSPFVEAYQREDGDNDFRLAPAILVSLIADDTPAPDPRWLELALTLRRSRTRPQIAHLIERVIETCDHPERTTLLKTACEQTPRSEFLRRLVGERHALLEGVDEAFVNKHDLLRALREDDDGWTLHTWEHRGEDVAAIFERLGDRISGLSFRGRGIPGEAMAKLAGHAALSRVTRLDLSGNRIGNDGIAALLKSPHIGQLTHLALDHCGISNPGMTMLGFTSNLPALRVLSVACERGDAVALQGLFDGSALDHIESLDLAGWDVDFASLVESQAYASLRRLHVTTSWEIEPMLANLGLQSLSFARARNNYSVDWREVDPGSLETLILDDCLLAEERTAGLFEAPVMKQLVRLSLVGCWIPGLEQLFASSAPELRRLSLRHIHAVDRELLKKLGEWAHAARLEELDVGGDTDLRTTDLEVVSQPVREAILRSPWPD